MLIGERLTDLQEFGLIDETPAQVLARISCSVALADTLKGAALVQESVRETLAAKQEIFAQLEARSAWRDRRLMVFMAHQRLAPTF